MLKDPLNHPHPVKNINAPDIYMLCAAIKSLICAKCVATPLALHLFLRIFSNPLT